VICNSRVLPESYADQNPRHYEEDHLIPLEIGGNPTDVRNLWPEPRNSEHSAGEKDKLENRLHELVCAQRLILRVQSAYVLDQGLTRRHKDAKKVRLVTLLKAVYARRTINP